MTTDKPRGMPPLPPKSITVTQGDWRVRYAWAKGVTIWLHLRDDQWTRVAWFTSPRSAAEWLDERSGYSWRDAFDAHDAALKDGLARRAEWFAARQASRTAS